MPSGTPVPSHLPDWDPNTNLTVQCAVQIDAPKIWDDCRLSVGDQLSIGVSWHSPGTTLRGCGDQRAVVHTNGTVDITLSMTIPASEVSRRVYLQACLYITTLAGGGRDPLAAALLGSTLWSDEVEILLEGIGSRFPVEIVNFDGVSWIPTGAAWYLEWDPFAPYNSLLGTVRLLVNAANSRVVNAVRTSDQQSPEEFLIRSAIYFDVGRTMVREMLASDEFRENLDRFPKGSVGFHVATLLKILFPGESAQALRTMATERYSWFDARLQAALRLFTDT